MSFDSKTCRSLDQGKYKKMNIFLQSCANKFCLYQGWMYCINHHVDLIPFFRLKVAIIYSVCSRQVSYKLRCYSPWSSILTNDIQIAVLNVMDYHSCLKQKRNASFKFTIQLSTYILFRISKTVLMSLMKVQDGIT